MTEIRDWRDRAVNPSGYYKVGAPPGMPFVWTRNRNRELAEACANDWPRLMYDGFGIWVSPEQEEAYLRLGQPGPRRPELGEKKNNWLSGGQRAGKTVFAFGTHADATLYKRGVDNTDNRFWRNYLYGTLAIAPTDALTLRLWQIGDEVSKGAHDSQRDRKLRRARGGAFLHKLRAGKDSKGNGIWRWDNGAETHFRSSEGGAYRLEGGQWWWITWDEWASQIEREIAVILRDILPGRARDHDAKIMPMAWPKAETERHLLAVIREIEAKRDLDSQVIYLSARRAPWTNSSALDVELRTKDAATIKRTVDGEPAGGASIEFKKDVVDNLVHMDLPRMDVREPGYSYLTSYDLGMAHDATVGMTWRIPILDSRRVVAPEAKARLVKRTELPGSDQRDIDDIEYAIRADQQQYDSIVALDATAMGGLHAFRRLRDMKNVYAFVSRSNDRMWGNMRLAAITNGLECLTWGRPEDPEDKTTPWGLVEMPYWIETIDQLANFDRDAKDVSDDEVWSFLIGLWYIRRWWVIGLPGTHVQRSFDVRGQTSEETVITRRGSRDMRRLRLVSPSGPAVAPGGVRLIDPTKQPRPPRA